MIEIVLDIETIPKHIIDVRNIVDRKLKDKKNDEKEVIKYCSLNWEFNQIICIGIKINNGSPITILEQDEKFLLRRFFEQLEDYTENDFKIITFNGKRFDIPIINLHSSLLNIGTSIILPNRRYDTFKHYDVLEILTNFYQNQNFLTLQEYCKVFEIENNDDSKGSNVYQLFQENKLDEIAKHCKEDIEATKKLYDRIKNYV